MRILASFASASSSDILLERTEKIPIPPFNGLEVIHEDWAATIESVHIHLDRGTVEAWCGEDKEIYNALYRGETCRSLGEIVKDYTDKGWSVS